MDLIWADELIGYDLVKTLRFRIATRSGKLIVTFTPVKGYSMTVKEYQSGARVLESAESELLPNNVNVPGSDIP
jgi:phage terminase large subunit-like protein